MPITYQPPGVDATELTSPSISSSLAGTGNLAIVGQARGYEIESQQITITSGTAPFNVTVTTSGETFSTYKPTQFFLSVTNAVNPVLGAAENQSGYAQGTDFTAELSANGETIKVTPIAESALSKGGIINFTYRVKTANYFEATRYTSQSALEATYGPAFNSTGIETPVSAAAYFAFEGGAQSVIIQPLFELEEASNPLSKRKEPTNFTAVETWKQSLYGLRSVPNINFIVAAVGQSSTANDAAILSILETVQDHVYYMETEEDQYIQVVAGEDSSTNAEYATDATIRSHAETLRARYSNLVSQNFIFIVPSAFKRPLPTAISTSLTAGGQYFAASVAGLLASSRVNSPLTRRIIPGWTSVPTYRDRTTKNADAQAGLVVIENNPGTSNTVIVRHAITLDDSTVANRALNVVRAKFFMLSSLFKTLNEQVIGQIPIDGNAPALVAMTVTQVLQSMVGQNVIVSYSGVQASLVSGEATRCQIAFSWKPAFPLDYINISFSVDLTNSNVTIPAESVVS